MSQLETFIQAYLEAVLFTDFGFDSEMPELSSQARKAIRRDCERFWLEHGHRVMALAEPPPGPWGWVAQAGHDFWLTRNGHGAGFWDGDWPEPLASALTEASRKFGSFDLFLGDDGLVYS